MDARPMDVSIPQAAPGRSANRAWLGFLIVAFATVGLMGLFATFAAPLPLQREAAREAALDAAAAAAQDPAALERLRPALDDSAAAILPADAGFAERLATEREAMRRRFAHEADVVANRLRWLVAIVTAMAAAFGVACFQAGRASGAPPPRADRRP